MFEKNLQKKGFTLIEILLVLVIIGILAAVVFAMIGNSDDAKMKATITTAKSVLTYAQECSFRKSNLNNPTHPNEGGNLICDESSTIWPGLSVKDCQYDITDSLNHKYEIKCDGIDKYIRCDAENGSCVEVSP